MAPLQRSFSMPSSSLSDVLSKFKVFSGRADKDEVSETQGLAKVPTLEVVDETDGDQKDSSPSTSGAASASSATGSDLPSTPPVSPRRFLVPLIRIASGGRRKDDASKGAGYHDGGDIERTASDPQTSSHTLTQRSYMDPTWYQKQSANLIMNALSRTGTNTPSISRSSTPQPGEDKKSKKASKDKVVDTVNKPTAGALAALGFRAAAVAGPTIQPASPIEEPPAKMAAPKATKANKAYLLPSRPVGSPASAADDARPSRSPSPFFRARRSREERRAREKSPEITALRKDSATGGAESAAESDGEGILRGRGGSGPFRPQASAYESPDESGDESGPGGPMTEDEHDDEPSDLDHDDHDDDHNLYAHDDGDDEFDDDDDFFDDQTKENTEANAIYEAPTCKPDGPEHVAPADGAVDDDCERDTFDVYGEEVEQDVLGEGPNVVIPVEPVFQAPTITGAKKRMSKKGLELTTSRPAYARDRCTINITQGDPDGTLDKSGKRMRRYVVLSDLSEESRYAVEWAVGTVARDGDELFLISVVEDEHKVDPKKWKDQSLKLKVQKERQTIASLLVRQVTSLLSRTRLNVTVTCQALHAKNARYMLLDLIDFLEPTVVIVGSRGLGQLKGILLGSTSHYLVQKSSVPVMVARRRMYRPLRSTDPEQLRHSPRVSLASANIEKAASKKQEDDIVDAAEADMVDVREADDDQGRKM